MCGGSTASHDINKHIDPVEREKAKMLRSKHPKEYLRKCVCKKVTKKIGQGEDDQYSAQRAFESQIPIWTTNTL